MGRSQTGNEGSPLKAWVWGRNRGLSSIRKTGLLLSFFFFILGAFYNILEQKDFLFFFLHILAFISNDSSKRRRHPLCKKLQALERNRPPTPLLGNAVSGVSAI